MAEDKTTSNSEAFSHIAKGVQSLVIAVGLCIAGGWTAYTFKTELHAQNAQAELDAVTRKLAGRVGFTTKMEVTPLSENDDETTTHVTIDVTITNHGDRDTFIVVAYRPAVRINRVTYNEDSTPQFESTAELHRYLADGSKSDGQVIRAGDSDTLSFCTQISTVGLHLVEFSADLPVKDRVDPDSDSGPTKLMVQKYINIPGKVNVGHPLPDASISESRDP